MEYNSATKRGRTVHIYNSMHGSRKYRAEPSGETQKSTRSVTPLI